MILWAFSSGAQSGVSFATMLELLPPADHVCGISAGAMISLYVALQEQCNIPELQGAIAKNSKCFLRGWSKHTFLNAIKAYFYHNSIYQAGSLFNLANTALDLSPSPVLLRDMTVGVWDATAFHYKEKFFPRGTPREQLLPYVQASASVPLIFPPKEIEGHMMRDGALAHEFPVQIIGRFEGEVHLCSARSLDRQSIQAHERALGSNMKDVANYVLRERAFEATARDLRLIHCLRRGKGKTWVYFPEHVNTHLQVSREELQELFRVGREAKRMRLEEWALYDILEV